MAVIELHPNDTPAVESVDDERRRRRESRQSRFLTQGEAAELQDLWCGYGARLWAGSVHAMLEAHYLQRPPSTRVRGYVVEELERAGGRAPEGRVIEIIAAEWAADRSAGLRSRVTRYEIRRAIGQLVSHGHVSKLPAERPASSHDRVSDAERWWTGFDLCLVGAHERGSPTMRLAARTTSLAPRADRWRAQDEAIRREWYTIRTGVPHGGRSSYEPEVVEPPGVRAAQAAIERLSARDAVVLRAVYSRVTDESMRFGLAGRAVYSGVANGSARFGLAGPVVVMTKLVEQERQARAQVLAASRKSAVWSAEELLATALREVRAEQVVAERQRDVEWTRRARAQAEQLVAEACKAYRAARRRRVADASRATFDWSQP